MSHNKIVVAYHDPCADGMAAAWALGKRLGFDKVDWLPSSFGCDLPDYEFHEDQHLICADFCYSAAQITLLASKVHYITVLDHHATTLDNMAKVNLPNVDTKHMCFDKSGATICWDYAFPGEEPPQILKFIEDRDLWRFHLPETKRIHAGLPYADMKCPSEFERYSTEAGMIEALNDGTAIEGFKARLFSEVSGASTLKALTDYGTCAFHYVPHSLASDCATHLYEEDPGVDLTCTVRVSPKDSTARLSFRSRKGQVNVRTIAEAFGGGGHPGAAGCAVDLVKFNRELEYAMKKNVFMFSSLLSPWKKLYNRVVAYFCFE